MPQIQCTQCGTRYARPQGTIPQINASHYCQVCGARAFADLAPPPSSDNAALGAIGGAVVGGALGGPPGALLGAIVGLLAGGKDSR